MAGCTPVFEFIGDPVLAQSLADREAWGQRFHSVVSEYGYRVRINWPATDELSEVQPHEAIADSSARVIFLSPYQSLVLEALQESPRSVVAGIAGAPVSETPFDLTVAFDPIPAWEQAGVYAARWQAEGSDREVVLFLSEPARLEGEAFSRGFSEGNEILPLVMERFRDLPNRQLLADALRRYPQGVDTLFVFLLDRANQTALELTRSSTVRLGLRGVDPAFDPVRILFSVNDDLIRAAGAVAAKVNTGQGDGPLIVESSFVAGEALR